NTSEERPVMRIFAAIFLFALAIPLAHSQQTPKPTDPPPQEATLGRAVSAEDAQALRQDLQRMRSLVSQMERNLASSGSAEDPVKHQFQLEIDMCQLQIASMERRLGAEPAKE